MKQTIFSYKVGDIETKHKVDFIYEPPFQQSFLRIKDVGKFVMYVPADVTDEFSDNPEVQIRHIKLKQL